MSNRPPVYDPNSGRRWSFRGMNVWGQVAIAICAVFGLFFVGFVIFLCIALNSYGNSK